MSSRYGLEIRALQPGDATGLSELLRAADIAADPRGLAERIEGVRASVNGTALLALEWGPPSGLVALHWHPTLFAPHPVARITALLVDPEQRRRGIGRLLVKAASQAARTAGCDRIELDMAAEATGLAAFAEATGFGALGGRVGRSLRRHAGS